MNPSFAFDAQPELQDAALPGLDVAVSYLAQRTAPCDATDDETTDWLASDEDATSKAEDAPARPTPDDMLNALAILRLYQAVERQPDILVTLPPGHVVTLVAGLADDRQRIAQILPELLRSMSVARSPMVHVEKPNPRDARAARDFAERLEGSLLRGVAVIAVVSDAQSLPPVVQDLALHMLKLPPLSPRMLASVLGVVHGRPSRPLPVTVGVLHRLTPLALVPVFAAATMTDAHAALERITALRQPAGQGPTLDDVHGQPEAVGALQQVVRDLGLWQAGCVPWREITKSFLLAGPPGTGKTLLAQSLAGSAAVAFVKTSYSDCQKAGHQGDMLRELHTAAERAIAAAPAVFFIDEIDSFYGRDGSDNGYIIGVVNGLLTLIDRLSATEGVILLAATNDPARVDPAVIRAGRFDRHIKVGPPDKAGIRTMLDHAFPDLLTEAELNSLAAHLLGLTGADIAALGREARTLARAAGRPLSAGDIHVASGRAVAQVGPDLLWRVAVHEAGHLVVGQLAGLPAPTSAHISPAGGAVMMPDIPSLTSESACGFLAMLLGGRAAEDIVIGDISSGSGVGLQSDLARATRLALQIEGSFGFGPTLSWVQTDRPCLDVPATLRKRVENRLRTADDDARRIVFAHRAKLEHVAQALMTQQELDAKAIAALLAGTAACNGAVKTVPLSAAGEPATAQPTGQSGR